MTSQLTNTRFDSITSLRLKGEVQLASNGDNAKSIKVTILANSGGVADLSYFGPSVFDFAGMTLAKPKIPLDWAHDPDNEIGYLNKFDTSSGSLICSGAIVPFGDDKGAEIVFKAAEGVPYEASIEGDSDFLIEYLPEGMVATVNNQQVQGPCNIFRQWVLKAVAICKFGADSDTSVNLQLSKSATKKEGLMIRVQKSIKGEKPIMSDTNKVTPIVEAKAEAVKATAVAEVEVKKEVIDSKVEAVIPAVEAREAVEATQDAKVEAVLTEVIAKANGNEVKATNPVAVEAVNPREEFRKYVAAFGNHAADYYAKGISFSDAQVEHIKAQAQHIASLEQKLSALALIGRGAAEPIKFSEASKREEKRGGIEAVIRPANKN